MFDKARLIEALERLGNDLLARGLFIELAVYRGSAIVLQFDWGRSTEYVDPVVREGYDEHALGVSVAVVARQMGLEGDWLNNAVGMYTPLGENDDLFDVMGNYPMTGTPGLRVLTAKPQYLLAMKLQALRNIDRGDKDLDDARALASHLAIDDEGELRALYVSIHGEEPHWEALSRFRSVLVKGA
ncbi:MAG: hypothetical protein VYD57_08390 [Pseudomonadota bacterium]|nr:hypothetical protein [Pseudomonadota bacterium]